MPFRRYVALGDSISIDLYPALDVAGPGALTSDELPAGLGAASLLFRNHDAHWPEFRGRDLATLVPGMSFRNAHALAAPAGYPTDNLTADGATTADILAHQLPRVERSEEPTLVTLTAGGNDMLLVLEDESATPVPGMVGRLERILEGIRDRLPNATIVVGTVYDPSNGTRDIGYGRMDVQAGWLAEYNEAVRRVARDTPGARLADIHAHFIGHGLSVPEEERWYWRELVVEPSARGASEVRRVWLECLGL